MPLLDCLRYCWWNFDSNVFVVAHWSSYFILKYIATSQRHTPARPRQDQSLPRKSLKWVIISFLFSVGELWIMHNNNFFSWPRIRSHYACGICRTCLTKHIIWNTAVACNMVFSWRLIPFYLVYQFNSNSIFFLYDDHPLAIKVVVMVVVVVVVVIAFVEIVIKFQYTESNVIKTVVMYFILGHWIDSSGIVAFLESWV